MYDRSSPVTTVNEARLDLYSRKHKHLVLHTQAALLENSKCAAYTAECVWGHMNWYLRILLTAVGFNKMTHGQNVDNLSSNCLKLPGTDNMWMQNRMLWKM